MKPMSHEKVFIPFSDGSLRYDCHDCRSICCLNGNLVMSADEQRRLLRLYPHLRFFFTRGTKKTYGIRKYPRCWFLEDSGLCSIQRESGYSCKPFICRMHPIYIGKCKDGYIAIPDGCSTLHVDQEAKGISHSSILKNAQESIDCGYISFKIDWSAERLNLEREILQGSELFSNDSSYIDFAAHQMSVTLKNGKTEEIRSGLQKSVDLWKSFLGLDKLELENKRVTHDLTAITSLLRVRSSSLRNTEVKKIPIALLSLYLYMVLFAKTRNARIYVQACEDILDDIPLALLCLGKDDLRIKNKSVESKLNYLRLLQTAYRRNEKNPGMKLLP